MTINLMIYSETSSGKGLFGYVAYADDRPLKGEGVIVGGKKYRVKSSTINLDDNSVEVILDPADINPDLWTKMEVE